MTMDITKISQEINKNAHEKGFWEPNPNIAEKLMLIVSEVAEALEADRKSKRCTNNIQGVVGWVIDSEFKEHFEAEVKDTFEDEIADAVIRLFDLSFQLGIDLPGHIKAKHRYNKLRPYKHGKKY